MRYSSHSEEFEEILQDFPHLGRVCRHGGHAVNVGDTLPGDVAMEGLGLQAFYELLESSAKGSRSRR